VLALAHPFANLFPIPGTLSERDIRWRAYWR
jgi:hypothetical protein